MIFKVSNIRKIIESLIFCFIAMLVLNGFIPSIGDYIIIIFIFAFVVLVVLMIRAKNIYLIEEEILTIFEGNEKSNILIRDISFIEHSTYLGTAGYFNGDGIQEVYSVITKDSKYKIDERLRNKNGKTLICVLEHSYHKKIRESSNKSR